MSLTMEIERQMGVSEEHVCTIPTIDMHLHFVDFMQRTDGFRKTSDAAGLIQSMKDGNIARNVIFGLPVKKKWEYFEPVEPSYYLDDNSRCTYFASTDEIVAYQYLNDLSDDERKLIALCINGFDPTDMGAIEYLETLWEKYPFWKGIGEVLFRHDDLTNLTIGETARCNHPAMYLIYDFCVKHDIPINIHQNSTSVDSSLNEDPLARYTYLHELEEVLNHYDDLYKQGEIPRNLKLIWAHCGVSRRVQHHDYYLMVNDMMGRHESLMVDLSWVCYENTVCEPKEDPDNPEEELTPKPEWIQNVIVPFSKRIMIGSDLCGHFTTEENPFNHGCVMARYNKMMRELAEIDQRIPPRIAYQNAADLYFEGE